MNTNILDINKNYDIITKIVIPYVDVQFDKIYIVVCLNVSLI